MLVGNVTSSPEQSRYVKTQQISTQNVSMNISIILLDITVLRKSHTHFYFCKTATDAQCANKISNAKYEEVVIKPCETTDVFSFK